MCGTAQQRANYARLSAPPSNKCTRNYARLSAPPFQTDIIFLHPRLLHTHFLLKKEVRAPPEYVPFYSVVPLDRTNFSSVVSGQTIATCGVLCDGDKQCNGFTTDALPSNTCWFYDYVQSLVVSGSPHRHVCKLSHVTNFKLFSIYSTIHILRSYIYIY